MGGDPGVAHLLAWYERVKRDLPWRRTRDPYCIWVSEIMLQQTRAQAAIPYYLRFLERFPDVQALARASESDVLTVWSGLGYYSRARNLLRAAREMTSFPRDYEGIRALPGVGPYTAAAIASIAFDLPYAVLDGNVLRVAARVANDASDIGSAAVRERFRSLVQGWLDPSRPGAFNQALMELGATVCLPRAPLCGECPLAGCCRAREMGTAGQLPVKLRAVAVERISAELAVVMRRGRVLLTLRDGFWHLPAPSELPGFRMSRNAGEFRHTITHRHYRFTVLAGMVTRIPAGMRWFSQQELPGIPLSTTARKALFVHAV